MDSRTSSALFKRAEQLKRWEQSDTNQQPSSPKRPSRIQFSPGIVFLAACTSGDKEEVQRMLTTGADINTANVDGLTALHQACIDDNLDMVEFLVANGADINRGDNEGWTPLHATASCGFLSIARFLLEHGADIAAVNYDGELPVDIAQSDAMETMLQKVIDEKGVDCEKSRNAEVNSLLSDARNWVAYGYAEVTDPKTGGTPLHVAAAKGYCDVAESLLKDCNVDPDSMDYEGWTPLHAAALWGQKEAAALLLKYGADPLKKNFSGQTCMDLVSEDISSWLSEAISKIPPRRISNNKRKQMRGVVKHVELEKNDVVNDKSPTSPEMSPNVREGLPPRARPPSPEAAERADVVQVMIDDEPPAWRRTCSLRTRKPEATRENNSLDDSILRRTHSFENDKTFYQRYRDVTARIKASSCPSIQPLPQAALAAAERRRALGNTNKDTNVEAQTRVNPSDRRVKENSWSPPTTSLNSSPTNTTTQTTVRSADGAESNSNSSNSTPSSTTPTKLSPGNIFKNFFKSFVPPVRDEESETQRKAHAKRVRETRRSTQGVTLDEIKSAEQLVKNKAGNGAEPTHDIANAESPEKKFELEDAAASPRTAAVATPAAPAAEATVTIPLRRPPTGATTTTTNASPAKDDARTGDEEKERESSSESKSSSNASSASTQAALNVIQRRRRPKRRSTGVGRVEIEDIINDRGGGGEGGDGDAEPEIVQSGSERTEDGEDRDYKALYEASTVEVRRLRTLLDTSEKQLRDARAAINRLIENQNSLTETEKREKRAMERKLSEMEEELKQLQKLKAENERLRAENRALTRVVSKLTNSATK